MVDAGAVPRLIDMLNGCDSLGQESAASALMMLASEEGSIRAMIVACNGIQALVSVLRVRYSVALQAASINQQLCLPFPLCMLASNLLIWMPCDVNIATLLVCSVTSTAFEWCW